jgi:hypothetical protein
MTTCALGKIGHNFGCAAPFGSCEVNNAMICLYELAGQLVAPLSSGKADLQESVQAQWCPMGAAGLQHLLEHA